MKHKLKSTAEQGTLMVEAIAMLGLIALVTPTLYKKSAERLQEIQDINIASQARTMNNVITSYISNNMSPIIAAMDSSQSEVLELTYDSTISDLDGYSSYIPFGYDPANLKNFGSPQVYARRDGELLISYILYPKEIDIGYKRSSRLASLVGANGGRIGVSGSDATAYGTGGSWELSNDELTDEDEGLGIASADLTENSLIITTSEPMTATYDDSEKYLYRVPPDNTEGDVEYYYNTMVTDLYMGGHSDPNYSGSGRDDDYYSIYNVRRLTLNTNCNRNNVTDASSSTEYCPDNVTDLYIGKPTAITADSTQLYTTGMGGNTGAAWIYGNFSALYDNFQVYRANDSSIDRGTSGYDVMLLARNDSSQTYMEVFYADNETDSAHVGMLDNFVQVKEAGKGDGYGSQFEFLVGSDDSTGVDNHLIQAFNSGNNRYVSINRNGDSSYTYINETGGKVSLSTNDGETWLNESGNGTLYAGSSGTWMHAQGHSGDEKVSILTGTSNKGSFLVGGSSTTYTGTPASYTIYGTDSYVGLFDSSFIIQAGDMSSEVRGGAIIETTTGIKSEFLDILGTTHMGVNGINYEGGAGGERNDYHLNVAGSAWIDEFLWAREAWFNENNSGSLASGYSSFADFMNGSAARFNVDDSTVTINLSTKGTAGTDSLNTLFIADDTGVFMSDTIAAKAELTDGTAMIGTSSNYFFATDEGTDSSASMVGGNKANIFTSDSSTTGIVNIQNEALQIAGSAGNSNNNIIDAKAYNFRINTNQNALENTDSSVQFMVRSVTDSSEVRVRHAEFIVDNTEGSTQIFTVSPDKISDSLSDDANVAVDGSFAIKGNEVIHVASNSSNAASYDNANHAMFEVDPNYVQVWAKDTSGNYVDSTGTSNGTASENYYAMLRINPTDTTGDSSEEVDYYDGNASIYVRKGAIELEQSQDGKAASTGLAYAADQGYGYIKANRFVSNVDNDNQVPSISVSGGDSYTYQYDQYMVNPAYTSVMHDIKLTTRGNARLSDVLPDFVLKGVYYVSNDFVENGSDNKRIEWSAGTTWCANNSGNCVGDDIAWASPYLGMVPYPQCPPGYVEMATVAPSSFNVAQAGEVIRASELNSVANYGVDEGRYIINPSQRQSEILSTAENYEIRYPTMESATSLEVSGVYNNNTDATLEYQTNSTQAGWFLGVPSIDENSDASDGSNSELTPTNTSNLPVYLYQEKSTADSQVIAQPLYFQQNTWLKTSLTPDTTNGWAARMGFIYDIDSYSGLGSGSGSAGITIGNDGTTVKGGNYVWNLFPVATNTLEGYAQVYCYFDRTNFDSTYVDQIDQLYDYRKVGTKSADDNSNSSYIERLSDPTLKYDDPW